MAVLEAITVRVAVPLSLLSETGLLFHTAVTPAGRLLTLRLMVPWKEPPAAKVKTSFADAPWTTETGVAAGVTCSVAGVRTTEAVAVPVVE